MSFFEDMDQPSPSDEGRRAWLISALIEAKYDPDKIISMAMRLEAYIKGVLPQDYGSKPN